MTCQRGYTDQMVEDANAVIFTFGSYRLGVSLILYLLLIIVEDFFFLLFLSSSLSINAPSTAGFLNFTIGGI